MKNKILKTFCFTFIGLLTFLISLVSASASTRGFAFRAFRENGEIKWKVYIPALGNNINGGKFISLSDGVIAFCIEPGLNALLVEDGVYDINTNQSNFGSITGYSNETLNDLELISFYGYGFNGDTSNEMYLATQLEIWERVAPNTVSQVYGDFSVVNSKRLDIKNRVSNSKVTPSFNFTTKDVIIGKETSFVDTNGVLSNFTVSGCNNCSATIVNNTLKVTSNSIGEAKVRLTRMFSNSDAGSILYTKGSYQKLMTFSHPDISVANLTLNTLGGTVELNKLDAETIQNIPQSVESSLKDAVYGIYKNDGTRIGTLTTDSNGYAKSSYLPSLGKYYLLEESPSKGYLLDNTKYYFDITADNLNPVVKVYEEIIKRDVEITKVFASSDSGIMTPESNVKFGFYDINNNLITQAITDFNGKLKVRLPYGKYTVKQLTTTPNYEKANDFTLVIENIGDSYKYTIANAEITAKLKVNKIDSESGRIIALSGIKFKIFDVTRDKYVCQTITYPTAKTICEFETDSTGTLITPYPLANGQYKLEEVDQKINGYLWNSDYVEFEIGDNSNFTNDIEFGVILETDFANTQVKGEIEVNKYGEKFVIEDGKYQYEEIKLSDVNYQLIADEDIYSGDGTLIYNNGDIVADFLTEDGYYKVDNLYLGNYCLVEISTDQSHILNNEKKCFSLTYKDQYTPVVSLNFNLKNYLKKGTLEFTKLDTNGNGIPKTVIEIYTENDELIFTGKTNNKSKIVITDLKIGKYKIKEKEASTGYVLSEEVIDFEILENNDVVKVTMVNEPITSSLHFSKIDFVDGTPIPDTLIQIFNDKDELVFEGKTDENGLIIIDELKYGKYYIIEKEANSLYQITDEKVYFEITENGAIVKATMTNEKIPVEVPNTSVSESKVLNVITVIFIIVGLGFIFYDKKRK